MWKSPCNSSGHLLASSHTLRIGIEGAPLAAWPFNFSLLSSQILHRVISSQLLHVLPFEACRDLRGQLFCAIAWDLGWMLHSTPRSESCLCSLVIESAFAFQFLLSNLWSWHYFTPPTPPRVELTIAFCNQGISPCIFLFCCSPASRTFHSWR